MSSDPKPLPVLILPSVQLQFKNSVKNHLQISISILSAGQSPSMNLLKNKLNLFPKSSMYLLINTMKSTLMLEATTNKTSKPEILLIILILIKTALEYLSLEESLEFSKLMKMMDHLSLLERITLIIPQKTKILQSPLEMPLISLLISMLNQEEQLKEEDMNQLLT